VDADAVFDAATQPLCGYLSVTMHQKRLDTADGVFGLRPFARLDDQGIVTATDVRPLRDDVQRGAVAVGRKEADGIALGLALVANFLGQTDGGQRAAGAEAFVVGDGRAFDGLAEPAGQGDGLAQLVAGGVVDGNADGDVGGVVANAALGDGLTEGFFEEDSIGDEL
jgi:hypothetical protein